MQHVTLRTWVDYAYEYFKDIKKLRSKDGTTLYTVLK